MDQELKQRWTAALRSGEYEQGTDHLGTVGPDGEEYCCLGVLCMVAKDELAEEGIEIGTLTDGRMLIDGEWSTLSLRVADLLGMPNGSGILENVPADPDGYHPELSAFNDCGATFSQIADLIDYAL